MRFHSSVHHTTKHKQKHRVTQKFRQLVEILKADPEELDEIINEFVGDPRTFVLDESEAGSSEVDSAERYACADGSSGLRTSTVPARQPLTSIASLGIGDEEDSGSDPFAQFVKPVSFVEHLLPQIRFEAPTPEIREAATLLLYHLDERGYMSEQTGSEINLPAPLLHAARQFLSMLDPIGSGLTGPADCLRLRAALSSIDSNIKKLIDVHAEEIVDGRWKAVAASKYIDPDAFHKCLLRLGGSSPSPATDIQGAPLPPKVWLDAEVELIAGDVVVTMLSDPWRPRLHVREDIRQSAADKTSSREYRTESKRQIRCADFLNDAITRRISTRQQVIVEIFRRESAFLEHGPAAIQPIEQASLAKAIGRDESTISRAIANTWVRTPFGVFSLRDIVVRAGGSESCELARPVIALRIKEIIDTYPQDMRITDTIIAELLLVEGIEIAPRTVCKYRKDDLQIDIILRNRLARASSAECRPAKSRRHSRKSSRKEDKPMPVEPLEFVQAIVGASSHHSPSHIAVALPYQEARA